MLTISGYDVDMKIIKSADENGNIHLRVKDAAKPDLTFIYSPYILKLPPEMYNRFSESIMKLSTANFNVEVVEDKYQSKNNFPENADITLKFSSYQKMLDFISKKDKQFCEELKFIINDIAATRNDDPDLIMLAGLHLNFDIDMMGQTINAALAILNKDLEINNKINQRIEQGMQYISELRAHIKIQQVLLAATDTWPFWKFLAFNSNDGSEYQSETKTYQNYLQG